MAMNSIKCTIKIQCLDICYLYQTYQTINLSNYIKLYIQAIDFDDKNIE